MSALRCSGSTYVAGGAEEYGSDGFEDWAYRVRAVCNDAVGCGFDMPVPEEDGEPAWGITNEDMDRLHAAHLAHSRGRAS
jgi:hypothetical protein